MNALFPLPSHGFIGLPGPDAAKFLQGLVTNDVRLVDPGRSTLGAICRVNGRVFSLFRVFERAGVLHLRLPREFVPSVLEHLARMVFRARVKPADASAGLAAIGVVGPRAAEILARLAGAAPAEPEAVAGVGDWTIVRVPGGTSRFEVYGPPPELRRLEERMAAEDLVPGDETAWRLLEIRAGIPELAPATVDAFLPQNLDLERLGALSFSKGCYPGQEVVARTQHLGEIKRRLVRARAEVGAVPAPGTRLRVAAGGRERDAGTVVQAAPSGDGGVELLAVVPVAEFEESLRIGHADGAPVRIT